MNVQDRRAVARIQQIIEEVERAKDLKEIKNLKKLTGTEYFYRIRVGDYRIGIVYEEGTIDFVRVLHQRDIYRHFP